MSDFRFIIGFNAVIAISILTGGCANELSSARQAVPQAIPSTVNNWDNGTVARVEFLKKFQLADYKAVVVMPVDTKSTGLPGKDDDAFEPVTQVLAKTPTLFDQELQAKLKDVIPVSAAATTSGGATLQVRIKLMQMSPGSFALRMNVGYGTGSTETLISGEIIDSQTGQALLRFEDGHRNKGSLFNYGYDSLLSDDVNTLADHVGILLEAFSRN